MNKQYKHSSKTPNALLPCLYEIGMIAKEYRQYRLLLSTDGHYRNKKSDLYQIITRPWEHQITIRLEQKIIR